MQIRKILPSISKMMILTSRSLGWKFDEIVISLLDLHGTKYVFFSSNIKNLSYRLSGFSLTLSIMAPGKGSRSTLNPLSKFCLPSGATLLSCWPFFVKWLMQFQYILKIYSSGATVFPYNMYNTWSLWKCSSRKLGLRNHTILIPYSVTFLRDVILINEVAH